MRATRAALALSELDATTFPAPAALPWAAGVGPEASRGSKFHTDLILLDLKLPALRLLFGEQSDQSVLNLVAWVHEVADACDFSVVGLQMAVPEGAAATVSGAVPAASCVLVLKSMTKVGWSCI